MGFTRKRRTVKLKFTDPDYEGFEVVIERMSFDDTYLFNDYELIEWERDVKAGKFTKEEIDAKIALLQTRLVEAIVSWNLEDDRGNPIPVSVAALNAEEVEFFWTLVRAWILAMKIRVDEDTKAPLSDGKPSEELQIPMEPLSDLQAS